MKVRITDRESFQALRPLDVAAYVRSTGWKLEGFWGQNASVWRSGERQIVLPEHTEFADFALRMAQVVEELEGKEKRSQLAIFRDLTTASSDVIRIRVASPIVEDGSLMLEEGVNLFQSAREMILAAARAAVIRRPYYRSRLPKEAENYIRKVKLGQTERGSYVATIVCPVSPELQSSFAKGDLDEPFDRRVSETLSGALSAAVEAEREAGILQDLEPFERAVQSGVSANLCGALANMGELIPEAKVEIRFSWARTRLRQNLPTEPITVSANAVPVLREAARVLRESYWQEDFELNGPVIRLESQNPSQGGDVVIHAEIDPGSWRKVRVHLGREDYQKATRAHEANLDVWCIGELRKEGIALRLSEPRNFGVGNYFF